MDRYLNIGFAIMVFILLSPLFRFAQLSSCENLTLACIKQERQALLKFRNNFHNYTSSYVFSAWEGEDCCKWRGIGCDGITRHVVKIDLRVECHWDWRFSNSCWDNSSISLHAGAISPSLLELKHLNHLDLSGHHFQRIQIPSFFGSMKHLKFLNLSNSGFGGRVARQLGNLTNLQVLDLSSMYESPQIYIDDFSWISQLSSLQYIDTSGVPMMKAKGLMQVISKLSSLLQVHFMHCGIESLNVTDGFMNYTFPAKLEVLNLGGNVLSGPIPTALQNMTSIRVIDLSENQLSYIPLWFGEFRNLVELNLAENILSGPIPSALLNMSSIKIIDLSKNWLSSSVPLWSIKRLLHVNLSHNKFTSVECSPPWNLRSHCDLKSLGSFRNRSGCIRNDIETLDLGYNEFAENIPSCVGELKNLMFLNLASNLFSGPIPQSFGNLTNLKELILEQNQFNGTIPASLCRLSTLRVLDLSDNHLKGIIPDSLGSLYNLYILDLSKNFLEGTINEIHLGNLSNLQVYSIGFNNLAVKLKPNWLPPFQLEELNLHSCRMESPFPQWLQTQNQLFKLDLFDAVIWGTIPKWLWRMNLYDLDLSNNKISGSIPENIHDNMPQLYTLLLGNNLINGSIPNSLCKLKELYHLDISKNKLSNKIPNCLWQIDMLEFIDLSSNELSGTIPNSICSGSFSLLQSLNLSNNSLHGELPINLGYCMTLGILDVGDNQISGSIPSWIGEALFSLQVLRLRGNMFNGSIPSTLCQLSQLQILDLAHNKLIGSIPHCIENLEGMMMHQDQFIYEKNPLAPLAAVQAPGIQDWDKEDVKQVIKGKELEYTKNLKFMYNMDLSSNKLIGCIPEGLTALSRLVNLNFSHNHLSGKIPTSIGKMKSLESVDLSDNILSGLIPDSMSLLTSLSYLNLSYNNFSGPIPKTNQFSTFEDDPSIYAGNLYLCGIPLQKCPGDEARQPPSRIGLEDKHRNEDAREKMLFYFVIAVGYVSGFWGVIGVLLLKKNWRHACFRYVEKVADNMYVAVAVRVARLKKAMETEEKQ